jgi:hypothetical protein
MDTIHLGEGRGLRSTHPMSTNRFFPSNMTAMQVQKVGGANADPEGWRCQCLVPCSKSGTSEIHWPFCQSIGLSVNPSLSYAVQVFTNRTVQHTPVWTLQRLNCTLNASCKDKFDTGCSHESGKTLIHRVPQSCISRWLADTRELQDQRSCRGC